MMVLSKPLIAGYDGEEVRLVPTDPGSGAVEQWNPEHELVRRFPAHFKPAPDTPADRSRASVIRTSPPPSVRVMPSVSDRPVKARHTERWRLPWVSDECRIGADRSRTRLRFSASTSTRMIDEFERAGTELEHGLLLLGCADQRLVEVIRVRPLGAGLVRGRDSLQFGREDLELVLNGDGQHQVVGLIHSHPRASAQPSAEDLCFWSLARRGAKLDRWVGSIALPLATGWQVHNWIVRPSAGGRDLDVAEPVAL